MHHSILLIDDTAALHQSIKAQLGSRFELLSAYDGKTGLISAAKIQPDLILLDVEMPAMGGYEVCRQLKADRVNALDPGHFSHRIATGRLPSPRPRRGGLRLHHQAV